ncbi:helix-turn-helix domain-containing protein [Paenibacillus sp. R14(2021)]|uniref:winged helix-turn-helix transcriptional regulator n=1 Tax=Paenibacillus sp. R14(2021) TaxID=2859228 RepID=UPI001C6115EA|nr:winged helix-turn-helix transcriptional regulator [Paenibacillus sp. R14(2021)]
MLTSYVNSGILTLDILAGKWKFIILLHILVSGTIRFRDLSRAIPGITNKVLTNKLRELEEEDIIERVVYAQIPLKVEYSITEYGKSLKPVLISIHEWGASHKMHKMK